MVLVRISKILVLALIALSQATVAEMILLSPTTQAQVTTLPRDSEDTLASVMRRMQPESTVKIAYREIRYLELMQEPWQASGFMYALAPDMLIMEQQLPQRVIMGAIGDQMFYYDPVNDVRHQGVMTSDDPISLNIAAFKSLITGDRELLEKIFSITFSANPEQWTLDLTSREDNDTMTNVVINGSAGQQASKIIVHQADGDRSEFVLTETERGEHLTSKIQQLHQELLGE